MMATRKTWRRALAGLALGAAVAGCAPLLVGGAMVGGAMVVTDRRPLGIQMEDQAIESRVSDALAAGLGKERGSARAVSYNRKVLLLGQVPTEAARDKAFGLADRAENVRYVMNELTVGPMADANSQANDVALSTKVRAALLEASAVPSGALAVTTEKAVVYLLGIVSEEEGNRAANVSSRVTGVRRVVKAFDHLTAEGPKPAPLPAPVAAPAAAPSAAPGATPTAIPVPAPSAVTPSTLPAK